MSQADAKAYLDAVYCEVPRILSLLDRNPFSKTYGCFHRAFWLHRTSDFPTAINQMGANILALLWKHPFEGNSYYQNEKILNWCTASIQYWMGLQHSDGSFDEWYPNERGWAGPTGYLVHAMVDSYFLLGEAFPNELRSEFKEVIGKAGRFLVEYNEEFILANHHAIALLPIYEAYLITEDESLKEGYEKKFKEFQQYCYEEGWSLEYDGVDIGYLSGTVSFLSRLYKHNPDKRIKEIVQKAVEFTSFYLYPNGFYGGSMGSRQTAHFYHFGYEFWSAKLPLAARMAEAGLEALSDGKLVSPGVQEDHYVLYRMAEYLEAYLAYQKRPESLPKLPWEKDNFEKYYEHAGIYICKRNSSYCVVNLKRGGVVKAFDTNKRKLVFNDCGWIVKLNNGRVATSQWNDPEYQVTMEDQKMSVTGFGNYMVMKTFTPLKMIVFRAFMLLFGWHPTLAYKIKGMIRRLLMVGTKRSPIGFKRTLTFDNKSLVLIDEWGLGSGVDVEKCYVGDEMPVRYVPQSRYFQSFELEIKGKYLSAAEIKRLNTNRKISITQIVNL